MAGVLAGFTAVEIGGEMAAPIAGMLLADNGADVIKVEPPGGDPMRILPGTRVWHRGKHSRVLDLEHPDGRAAFESLLDGADVLLTGLPVRDLRALGLDGPSANTRFPRLVACNITGYGLQGRDAHLPGRDSLIAARLGLQHLQAGPRPGPHFLGFAMPSYSAAMLALTGIATALYLRERTGKGQAVDVSLKDGALAMMTMSLATVEKVLGDVGFGAAFKKRLLVQNFECQDGEWVHLHTGAIGAFDRLMQAVHLEEHVGQPFPNEAAWQAMVARVEARFRTRDRDAWLEVLEKADVPALPILRHGHALLDEQSRVMGFAVHVEDPELGTLLEVAPPIVFEKTPGAVRGSAPRVGEHTRVNPRSRQA
jgi:crotonobetainyl-CoA:carnitine CoA-transferase CaiB-like acyl-CoA transferase